MLLDLRCEVRQALKEMLATHHKLAERLDDLERRYDAQFKSMFDAIRRLMAPPKNRPRQIGFKPV